MEEEAGQERGGDEDFVLPGEEILEVTRGGLDKESKTSGEECSIITLRQGGWGVQRWSQTSAPSWTTRR